MCIHKKRKLFALFMDVSCWLLKKVQAICTLNSCRWFVMLTSVHCQWCSHNRIQLPSIMTLLTLDSLCMILTDCDGCMLIHKLIFITTSWILDSNCTHQSLYEKYMQHCRMPTYFFVKNFFVSAIRLHMKLCNFAPHRLTSTLISHNYTEEKITVRSHHKTFNKLPQY